MYRPYPYPPLHHPRLEAAIDFGVALWRWLRGSLSWRRPDLRAR